MSVCIYKIQIRYGDRADNIAASQLQGPQFDTDLGLLSVYSFTCSHVFVQVFSRWTGYCKLAKMQERKSFKLYFLYNSPKLWASVLSLALSWRDYQTMC